MYKSHYIKTNRKRMNRVCLLGAVIWTTVFFLLYFFLRMTSYHVRSPQKQLYDAFVFLDNYLFLWWLLGAAVTVLAVRVMIYRRIAKSFDLTLDFMKQIWNNPEQALKIPTDEDGIYNLLEFFQTKLHDTTKAIKQEQQRKNELVLYLAHDLKTPLTSIQGYLDIIMEQPELPVELRQKYLGVAVEKSERLEDLINEFFEISRFNLTDMELHYAKVNLSRLIEQEAFEFQPMMEEKALTCETDMPESLLCRCDPDKMQRVIDNLLRNAVNYSYAESAIGIKVTEEENRCRITVKNRGDAISKEALDRLFDQFFRLDASRNSKTGGSGIGLAIAKKIMEAHKGSITAKCEDGFIIFELILPK